jgi:hypothetical protein
VLLKRAGALARLSTRPEMACRTTTLQTMPCATVVQHCLMSGWIVHKHVAGVIVDYRKLAWHDWHELMITDACMPDTQTIAADA